MNRAERRRASREAASDPVISIKRSDLEKVKAEAVKTTFELLLAIPTMVIHNKFGLLMKKEGREERFVEFVFDLYNSYEKGSVTIENLRMCLQEEAGIKIE